VAPDRVPPLIYSLPQKLRVIESCGVDTLLLIHFDEPFSQQTGEVFIRRLAGELGHVHSLCVGADFTFGWKRSGNVALLNRLGADLAFTVHGLAPVSLDGEVISSTRIREAIAAGEFDLAGRMLGRPYTLAGRVTEGDRLGRQLGFPTANLDVTGLVLPPRGVYAGRATVRGRTHRAVVNIGVRPTLPGSDPPLRVEAHLLDFDQDLRGEDLEIFFVTRLRDERKFSSLDGLKAQIARDVAQARSCL
jgi:riboflavin kinase/FMN adenylyltransferase